MRRETNRTEQRGWNTVSSTAGSFLKREKKKKHGRTQKEETVLDSNLYWNLLEEKPPRPFTWERKKTPGKLLLLSSLLLGGFALFFLKRREIERRKFADLLRDADALCSPRCRLVGGEFDPGSERDGTHRPGGEVFGGVWLQPDLGPHGHRTRHLRALRQREGGVFRSPEHQPWAVRDEQPNHGYLLRPGRKFKILLSIFGMKCLVLIGKKCVF